MAGDRTVSQPSAKTAAVGNLENDPIADGRKRRGLAGDVRTPTGGNALDRQVTSQVGAEASFAALGGRIRSDRSGEKK
jgi:hypothetical protein